MPQDECPFPEPVPVPLEPVLDLHTFAPAELGSLLPAYLDACVARGFREVRIIHGKGTGTLRRTVIAHLERAPQVASFCQAPAELGSWGATLVKLNLGTPGCVDVESQKKLRK